MQNTLHVAHDGEEALAFLLRQGKYSNACRPDMILLDINLPKMDGIELLNELQGYPELAAIPVVILTTSRMHEEIVKKYNIPVDCYIAKPLTFERYMDAVRCFPHLGMSIVTVVAAGA